MKAPDKLFLHPNYRGEVGANWLTFPLTEKDECYIRKDALLEFAKEHYGRLESIFNVTPASVVGGKMDAYKEIIDKIESL